MTFKAYYEVIGFVNELYGGFGMIARWARKYVYKM